MMFYFSSSFSTNKTEIVWKNRRKFQKIVFEVFSFLFSAGRQTGFRKGKQSHSNLLLNF